jgi:hypothetical protein
MKKILSILTASVLLCTLSGCNDPPRIPTDCDYTELYCAEGYQSDYLFDCFYSYTHEDSSGNVGDLHIADRDFAHFQFQNGQLQNAEIVEQEPYTTFSAHRETESQKKLLTRLCANGSIPGEVLEVEEDSRFYWNYRDYTVVFCNRYAAKEAPILIRYDSGTGEHPLVCTLTDSTEPNSIQLIRYGNYLCFDDAHTIDLTTMKTVDSFEKPELPKYTHSVVLETLEAAKSERLENLITAIRSDESLKFKSVDGVTDDVVIYFQIEGTTYLLECDESMHLQRATSFSLGDWCIYDMNLYNDGYDWYIDE